MALRLMRKGRTKSSRVAGSNFQPRNLGKEVDKASAKFTKGDHIAAKRFILWHIIEYTHLGVVVEDKIIEGRNVTMVVHLQRPSSQSDKSPNDYTCKCGYTGPPKVGLSISCLDCFKIDGCVFRIQHIGSHLLSLATPEDTASLEPGKVLYRGYCNDNFYLGYFSNGICKGYMRVRKKDYKGKPIDNRVRFVETSQRSKEEVLKAAGDENTNLKPYNLFSNNCEHSAMLIMTGERRSFQLENCPKRVVRKVWKSLCNCFGAGAVPNNVIDIGEPSEPIPEE